MSNRSDNTSVKMVVLAIGYVWPEPNSSAAGKHMMSLLRLFQAQGWQVHFASPAQRSEHQIDLTMQGIQEQDIALNCSTFDEFIRDLAPDVVLFDRFMLEEQFAWRVAKVCPNAIRILDTEDLHFVRHGRQQAHKQSREVTRNDLQSDMAKREIAAILRCDLSLIISDYELALLSQQFSVPHTILCHAPFMLEEPLSAPPEFAQRTGFISIGNFRHGPNWDAVLWLKQTIWPAIRQRLPDAELQIYGAYPPPKATQLHNPKQGFLVKGWAENAETVMSEARVCLAPLRFGAGIKGKLADAMLCGTPSVTTSVGAEGMQGESRWPGKVTDNLDEFVEAAVSLYQDEGHWRQAQGAASELLKTRFNREQIEQRIMQHIGRIRENLAAHRAANFTGQMLLHHSLMSTQYMGQWIEAKNKLPKT